MLIFRFPPIMIAIFSGFILIATALSSRLKARPVTPRAPQSPVAHPILFRILSFGVVFSAVALGAVALFTIVSCANHWMRWRQFEAQPYHRSDFQVAKVYYQRHSKGGVSVYASGTVEGQREWMDLEPYLHLPHYSEAEVNELVPTGTSIPIYLFPALKGQARTQVFNAVPTAEMHRRAANAAISNGLFGLALAGAILFLMVRLRRLCFGPTDSATQPAQPGFQNRSSI
jgi:hypothetical protein